jgi:uncharacterized protein YndB with AHSA1/START domain
VETGRCSVRLTRRYDAPPTEVWTALTEPESQARWLGSTEAIAGVRESDPPRLLELDWRAPGEDLSLVRFELSEDGRGGTVLVVDHSRIDERFGMQYMTRWTEALARFRP